MKSLNKKIPASIFLIVFLFLFLFINVQSTEKVENIILIALDGIQRNHLMELLSGRQLPNLEKLISEGSLVYTEVTTGKTETKPGWAEILTGYSAIRLGIPSNKVYGPIPEGYTIFERLKKHFGRDNIVTIFIGGKTDNIGSRGPHEICDNCVWRDPVTRRETLAWDKQLCKASTKNGEPQRWIFREGEPYFNSKKVTDFHLTGLGAAENVGQEALRILNKYHNKPFFAFFHFEEPDEQGHVYGENSLEYSEGLEAADYWLGAIIKKLKDLHIYEKTTIFVTSDHGMDEGGFQHYQAPYTFLATNSKRKLKDGDRKDITPTILDEYAIDLGSIKPPLDGRSLFIDNNKYNMRKK